MTYSNQIMNRDKILVLIADIDDDLGEAGIETPIIGYRNVLEKAVEFAKKKPYDSDVNGIFGGLAVYEKLSTLYGDKADLEIAVVSGARDDWTKAMAKLHQQLKLVKEVTGFKSIYFVSDGVSDEQLIPVLSSYGSILGVERIIVEQSPAIEETYILFLRYLKKAFTEPPYTKFFLGIPGVILFLWGLFSLLGLSGIMWSSIVLLIGVIAMIKGFNVSGLLRSKWEFSPVVAMLYIMGSILLGLALFLTGVILYVEGITVSSFVSLLNVTTYPYFIGLILVYGGRIFEKALTGKPHLLWRDSVFMALVVFLLIIAIKLGEEISSLPGSIGLKEVFNLVTSSEIMIIILLMTATIFVLTIIFTIIERRTIKG